MLLVFWAALLLFNAGCTLSGLSQSERSGVELPEVILREGETVDLKVYGATLTFVRKLEDSRCPIDVVCVWSGTATILIEFSPERGEAALVKLDILGSEDPSGENGYATKDTLGYRFELRDLVPYPTQDNPSPDAPSTATLRIAP